MSLQQVAAGLDRTDRQAQDRAVGARKTDVKGNAFVAGRSDPPQPGPPWQQLTQGKNRILSHGPGRGSPPQARAVSHGSADVTGRRRARRTAPGRCAHSRIRVARTPTLGTCGPQSALRHAARFPRPTDSAGLTDNVSQRRRLGHADLAVDAFVSAGLRAAARRRWVAPDCEPSNAPTQRDRRHRLAHPRGMARSSIPPRTGLVM